MFKEMMIYFIRHYSRSYRYVPPMFGYLMFVVFLYSFKPNAVMSSFAVTASVLFVVSSWIGYTLMQSEHPVQEQLAIIHLKSVTRYHIGLLTAVLIVAAGFAAFAIAYPIVFHRFARQPDITEVAVGLLAHLGMCCLGAAIACFFNSKLVPRAFFAIGGLLGVSILSFCQGALEDQLGSRFQWIVWPLPPVFQLIDLLMNFDGYSIGGIIGSVALPFLYAAVLGAIFIAVMKKRYAG